MNNEAIKYIFKTLGQNSESILKLTKNMKRQKRMLKALAALAFVLAGDNFIMRQKLKVYDAAITDVEKDIRELKKEV